MNPGGVLLEVKHLRTCFWSAEGEGQAVDDVSFTIQVGEVLGMVGESGCGKSVTSLSIMRLIPEPPGKIAGGEILFDGRDLLRLSAEEMRRVRGRQISMIFQEPMTSLNPVFTVGYQIMEGYMLHTGATRGQALDRALELMKLVGIPSPERRVDDYPHQFSGGMRQRIMIAMALSCDPRLVIADEPTTALDVTIQAQILELMNRLRTQLGMAILLITHDLAVIAETAHRVVVMYAGKIVEEAAVEDLFHSPLHPYTQGLMGSIPRLVRRGDRLVSIDGMVPSPFRLPAGCRFFNRCKRRMERCERSMPPFFEVPPGSGHRAACFLHEGAAT
ncbi:MAG: ABC transporter ATP-binding protein [Candidatus Riflebacteria bacterium]|nr:ABC transporter ATP-binding protein [Candidatus Riflebacteria bacterium]